MLIKSKKIEIVDGHKPQVPSGFIHADFGMNPQSAERVREDGSTADFQEEDKRAEAQISEAYDRGFSEGLKIGADTEREKLSSAVAAFSGALLELARLKKELLSGAESQILDLSVAIAGKIIQQELTVNREVFAGVLRSAIRNILDKEGIKIRLNPKDYEYMVQASPDILSGFEGVKDPVFEADAGINQGGVIIETLFGEVDARLEKQMGEIINALQSKR
ncbi:MAG: FliH/SctL family protein [Syntrophales bacterium]